MQGGGIGKAFRGLLCCEGTYKGCGHGRGPLSWTSIDENAQRAIANDFALHPGALINQVVKVHFHTRSLFDSEMKYQISEP